MYQKSTIVASLFLSITFVLAGCQSAPPPAGGFAVTVAQRFQNPYGKFGPPQPVPYVTVSGGYVNDDPNTIAQGTVKSYNGTENDKFPGASPGDATEYWVAGGRAPAYWNHVFSLPFYCGDAQLIGQGQNIFGDPTWTYIKYDEYTFLQTGFEDDCFYYYNGLPGTYAIPGASTRFAILGQQPQTLTLSSEAPLHTTYGMPLLYVYNGARTVVATETATSVSSDGTQATFPFPSTLAQNGYSLALVNQTGSSPGFSPAGTNLLSIASSQTIAGNPFGVAVSAQTSTVQECLFIKNGWKCNSTTQSSRSPVVTLYSANQVLVGTAPVGVGANPTAVATYSSSPVTNTVIDGGMKTITTTSGTTRAIVANSGGNTLSVLDIVNNALLYTIPVGNQPVALAVSSDGGTAYVANYTDSTVTQVNLNSGAATATIAVGGHPTSVALTAAGTLWVGGIGFLTQMNAQPMNVVATQPLINRSIAALGFSNSLNQLVATTVDTNSNVYVDEINPTTVQTGSAYTPIASTMVSSLGTHLNQRLNVAVQAYSATLASANLINPNQAGAPPLVVQDGWAVVTATPTGFTITDITGHVVLVSETTPSPVTAIAVDSKLNVAYLVMPDSNTLLTVPLPGTN